MNLLIFDPDEVQKILDHASASPQFRQVYGEDAPRTILLVHDQGIYLMSNGYPILQDPDKPEGSSWVTYAQGCNPSKDPEWWDNARDFVGGDDFAEPIDVADAAIWLRAAKSSGLRPAIRWLEDRYNLEWAK